MRKICNSGEWLSERKDKHGDSVVRGMLSFQIVTVIRRQNKYYLHTVRGGMWYDDVYL